MHPSAVSAETVFAAVPVGLGLVAPDRSLRLANPAFLALLGLPQDAVSRGVVLPDGIEAASPTQAVPEAVTLLTTSLADGWTLITAMPRAETPPNETLSAAIGTMHAGLALFAPDRRLLLCNPGFGTLLSIPVERLRAGTHAEMLLPAAILNDWTAPHPEAARIVRPDGLVLEVSRDDLPDGSAVLLVNEGAQQARAEQAARDRAALLDMVLLNVPHGICVYGLDQRVAMFNDTYNRVMEGAPLRIGDTLVEVIRRRAEAHEYGEGDPEQVFAEQMAHDIGAPQMRRRVRPNGTAIDIRTVPLPNGGHLSVVTDMTALVRAESAVRQSAQEMATMLGSIHHGIVLWGADHRLIASNPIAGELLGLPAGFLTVGRIEADVINALLDLGELGEGDPAADRARELLNVDRTRPFAREFHTRSGRIVAAQSNPAPNGGWVTTYTDATPMRHAEAELRAARDQAEAASRAKSRFLATMGHELRTPLNAIIGFSDLLMRARGQVPRAEITEFSQLINEAGHQLLALIDTILNVVRLETGRFQTSQDTVDVARMLRLACRQMEIAARASEIALGLVVPADLPAVRADERQLYQAVVQILANGVKFTPAGGSVTVRAERTPDAGLSITVADNGIGIEPDKLEQVFEPFVQADETLSRRYPGAGVGLFMARAIVAAHDGTMTLDSAAGKGTTVRITLPPSRLLTNEPAPGDAAIS